MRVRSMKPAGPLAVMLALAACLGPACRSRHVSPADAVKTALEARIGSAEASGPIYCRGDKVCGSDILPSFYRARGFRPAWIDDGLALADARAFLEALRGVSGDGLDPENYHRTAIASLLSEVDAARRGASREAPPKALADLEMLLTDAFLLCGSHLVHGQVNPETIQSEWFIKGRVEDLAAALERGLARQDVPGALDSLRPSHAVYRGLMKALREYEAIGASAGWPGFPPGPKLVKGDRAPRVEALRGILTATGELRGGVEAAVDPDLFDDALEAAVKRFQRRHGLEPDGVVGAETSLALGIPAKDRLAQVRANLERWRWITPELGERYVMVNTADFRLSVVEGGRELQEMAVIVGTAYRRTPDFSGTMTYLELNPGWSVPPKLAREDILPKVRQAPSYLSDKGFRIYESWSAGAREIDPAEVDWAGLEPSKLSYKLFQEPGPENALGQIKFMFPNKFDVYLHDTPERGLFRRAVRSFSSGCIRVERPVELAERVLGGDDAWDRETILAAIESRKTRVVRLPRPWGVHLLYWTSWLGADGRVQFRQDIYLRDETLNRALRERASDAAAVR